MKDNNINNNQEQDIDNNVENNNSEHKGSTTIFKKIKLISLLKLLVVCGVIWYFFFMPNYQKQIISNLNPFKSYPYNSKTQRLENAIDKDKIVELPSKKTQNLAAFLDEFGKFEDFTENPNYFNLLEILEQIEIEADENGSFFAELTSKYYQYYINQKLYKESSMQQDESLYDNESSDEQDIEEVEEIIED